MAGFGVLELVGDVFGAVVVAGVGVVADGDGVGFGDELVGVDEGGIVTDELVGTMGVEGVGVIAGEVRGVVVGGGDKEFSGVGGGGIVTDELVGIVEVGVGETVGVVIDEPVGAIGKTVGVVIGMRTGCVCCAEAAEDPSKNHKIIEN